MSITEGFPEIINFLYTSCDVTPVQRAPAKEVEFAHKVVNCATLVSVSSHYLLAM